MLAYGRGVLIEEGQRVLLWCSLNQMSMERSVSPMYMAVHGSLMFKVEVGEPGALRGGGFGGCMVVERMLL